MLLPNNLLRRLGCGPDEADRIGRGLVAAIEDNRLPYHNLAHVRQTLTFADRWRALTSQHDTVELALWFHDIVYDPQRSDNEAQSAALMRRWLAPTVILPEIIDGAAAMIRATQHHDPQDAAAGLVVDADLSILAAGWPRYQAYAAAIRLEYSWVSDASYKTGRMAVLKRFLQRPQIYYHPSISSLHEFDARQNIDREIKELRAR